MCRQGIGTESREGVPPRIGILVAVVLVAVLAELGSSPVASLRLVVVGVAVLGEANKGEIVGVGQLGDACRALGQLLRVRPN